MVELRCMSCLAVYEMPFNQARTFTCDCGSTDLVRLCPEYDLEEERN